MTETTAYLLLDDIEQDVDAEIARYERDMARREADEDRSATLVKLTERWEAGEFPLDALLDA